MTIHELSYQIKTAVKRLDSREVFTVLLIILVGFGSFGLGRLSRLEEAKGPVYLEETLSASVVSGAPQRSESGVKDEARPNDGSVGRGLSLPAEASAQAGIKDSVIAPGGQLVASKSGAKYHFPWCAGAKQIAEKNKIWFASVEEARKAGYTPASNCKGLK